MGHHFISMDCQKSRLNRDIVVLAGLRKGETLTDLYCGVGLLGVSCAVRAKADGKPLKRLQATDINNKATVLVKKNAAVNGLESLDLKKIKSCDLEQQTLGQSVRTHVVIVGKFAPIGLSCTRFLPKAKLYDFFDNLASYSFLTVRSRASSRWASINAALLQASHFSKHAYNHLCIRIGPSSGFSFFQTCIQSSLH